MSACRHLAGCAGPSRFVGAVLGLVLSALLVEGAWATAPALEVLPGSSVTLIGTEKTIAQQTVGLVPVTPPPPTPFFSSGETLVFPRISLALDDFVDIFQNQNFMGDLDTSTGDSSITFPLWVIDSGGTKIELSTTFTTGTPDTRDCAGFLYCFGDPGDPPECSGTAWDPITGDVRYVGITLIPFGAGTFADCRQIVFVLEGRIQPGDVDSDEVEDPVDNCPDDANLAQVDSDGDGIGDVCDNCPSDPNTMQGDIDSDGTGNACQPLLVNFQPESAAVPAGYEKDFGAPYDPGRGFGWLATSTLPSRDRNVDPDQRRDTFVFTENVIRWEAVVGGGVYDVDFESGDPAFAQGPHMAAVEGVAVIEGVSTSAGEYLPGQVLDAPMVDGRVTVDIGGGGGSGTETMLNHLSIVESSIQPFYSRFVNFQPATSQPPLGFDVDSGAEFDAMVGFGWEGSPIATRDRNILGDLVLDTFAFTSNTPRSWEIAVPADYYEIQIGVGDAQFSQGPQAVIVEGETWLSGAVTQAGEILTLSGRVLVLDGFLSIDIGEQGGVTPMDYVSLLSASRDLDADSVVNFIDNCFEISNPGQEDLDGNGVGDACNDFEDADGDNWADVLDNCPQDANSLQENQDGDKLGDACDCAVSDPTVFEPPGEVQAVLVVGSGSSTMSWDSQPGTGTVYDVVVHTVTSPPSGGDPFLGAGCASDDHGPTDYTDPNEPAPGEIRLYLVRAENVCGTDNYGVGVGVPDPRNGLNTSGPCS